MLPLAETLAADQQGIENRRTTCISYEFLMHFRQKLGGKVCSLRKQEREILINGRRDSELCSKVQN